MPQSNLSKQYPQYYKNVEHLAELDVYVVHDLFGVNDPSGALQHASKKILLAGVRNGGKPALADIREACDSLNRYLAIQEQKTTAPTSPAAANQDRFDTAAQEKPQAETPAPVKALIAPGTNRWVILYYHPETSRRFSPEEFYTMADTQADAIKNFYDIFPKASRVWITRAFDFKKTAAEARKKYWASR